MYMRSRKKAIAIFVSLVIGIGIIFACVPQLNQRLSSITEVKSGGDRIYLWKSAYHMFLDNPFLGVGYNQFADKYQNQYILPEARQPKLNHAHSNFMQMLAEGGILGITTWSLFWGYALWYGYSGWKKDRKISALAWFVVIAGFQLHGLTEYNQGNSAATKEFWFLLGIFLQLMWISKHNSKIKLR